MDRQTVTRAANAMQVGDVLTIDNDPRIPPTMQWRVDAIVPGRGIRLRPATVITAVEAVC